MEQQHDAPRGSVQSLWRYPVKSMLGEALQAASLTARGVAGDRRCALIDVETGRVVSAKNPRRWPTLFAFQAEWIDRGSASAAGTGVRITLPDGRVVKDADSDVDRVLSDALGRSVRLTAAPPEQPMLEVYSPNLDGTDEPGAESVLEIPPTTFFDSAPVHVLTTATLDALAARYPEGRFDVRRFRPNIVVAMESSGEGFLENDWIGRTLSIGDVRLAITDPCPRCVMTTLAQKDLPQDLGILRTATRQNHGNVGALGTVLTPGIIRRGDPVRVGERISDSKHTQAAAAIGQD